MGSQFFYRIKTWWRTLWIRATLISLLGLFAAAISPLIAPLIQSGVLWRIKEDTVRSLLDILANSMLTVTTFSLTIMVTTHLTAAQQVTPRVHRLLRSDTRTQNVLATFIGAFVFSLSSIVLLQLDLVGEGAYAVLYITTLFVIALVIAAILRWVGHLSSLGSLENSTRKVQDEAQQALSARYSSPFLGGEPAADVGENAHTVFATSRGFVQHIDTEKICGLIQPLPGKFHVMAVPGDLIRLGEPLGHLETDTMDSELEAKISDCFTLGDNRTYAQDAVFGISVLTEIAERALSPAVNDPQTALDIVARLAELLDDLPEEVPGDRPDAAGVHVPALNIARAVEASFPPIARDGSTFVEVQVQVQLALAQLAECSNPAIAEAARIASAHALAYAEDGLLLAADRARVRKVAVAREPSSR